MHVSQQISVSLFSTDRSQPSEHPDAIDNTPTQASHIAHSNATSQHSSCVVPPSKPLLDPSVPTSQNPSLSQDPSSLSQDPFPTRQSFSDNLSHILATNHQASKSTGNSLHSLLIPQPDNSSAELVSKKICNCDSIPRKNASILNKTLALNKEILKLIHTQRTELKELMRDKSDNCESCSRMDDILFQSNLPADQKVALLQTLRLLHRNRKPT